MFGGFYRENGSNSWYGQLRERIEANPSFFPHTVLRQKVIAESQKGESEGET